MARARVRPSINRESIWVICSPSKSKRVKFLLKPPPHPTVLVERRARAMNRRKRMTDAAAAVVAAAAGTQTQTDRHCRGVGGRGVRSLTPTSRHRRHGIMGKLGQWLLDSSQNWSEIKQSLCGEWVGKKEGLKMIVGRTGRVGCRVR